MEGLEKTQKTCVRIAGVQTEIFTRDLLHTEHECHPLYHDTPYKIVYKMIRGVSCSTRHRTIVLVIAANDEFGMV
jgi:hypothetical protein